MLAVRCVRAEVFGLTKTKSRRLCDLYAAWQSMTQTRSTYRELRNRFPYLDSRYARAASYNLPSTNEPLHLPKDMFRIVNRDGKFAHFFLRIPTEAREYLWLPLRMNRHMEEIVHRVDYGDSELIRRGDRFFLHLTVKRQVKTMEPSSLLGVDLGERNLATAVLWQGSQVSLVRWFYGREARGIRRHYAWLRKRLGERKLLREVKRISGKEQRAINNLCHNVSREIVHTARLHNSAIILGDLKGIRTRAKGRRMNRVVSSMPFFKLSQFIEYKAAWEGIPVITTNEAYTSRTCPRCGSQGRRPTQGLFQCPACGFQANADYVGARNLTERAARWFAAGALRVQAQKGDMTCDESPQVSQHPKT
jgi:IS605 OrfB family transposase